MTLPLISKFWLHSAKHWHLLYQSTKFVVEVSVNLATLLSHSRKQQSFKWVNFIFRSGLVYLATLLSHSSKHLKHYSFLKGKLYFQERLHQTGLDAILREERQSLLTEVESLQSRLSQQRQEVQDLRSQMAESLAQQEENSSNKTWKLQREGEATAAGLLFFPSNFQQG